MEQDRKSDNRTLAETLPHTAPRARSRAQMRLIFAIVVTGIAVCLAIIHLLNLKPHGVSLQIDTTLLVVLIVGGLPWIPFVLPSLGERIKSIEALGVKIKLLQNEVGRQSERLSEQQEILNKLTVFSMESDIFDTLENLDRDQSFTFDKKWTLLVRQFQFLFDRGLISHGPDDLENGKEVGHGMIVTQLGKVYISLRQRMQSIAQGRSEH